jgi:hypothetical protein
VQTAGQGMGCGSRHVETCYLTKSATLSLVAADHRTGSSLDDEDLVTGGAAYIGSITATALEEHGHTDHLGFLLAGPRIFPVGPHLSRWRHSRPGSDSKARSRNVPISTAQYIWRPQLSCQSRSLYRMNTICDNVAKIMRTIGQLEELQRPSAFPSSASAYARLRKDMEVFEDSPAQPSLTTCAYQASLGNDPFSIWPPACLRAIILRYFNPLAARLQCETFTVTGIDYQHASRTSCQPRTRSGKASQVARVAQAHHIQHRGRTAAK